MKNHGFVRCLACFLVLCLLIPAAMAEAPDLSSYSDEQILELLRQVNAEIVNRRIGKTATLPQGTYYAGSDIPAGRYIYTCLATGDDWGNVTVYSDGGKGSQLLWNVVSAPKDGKEPTAIYMVLNRGDQLKSGVPFSLTVMTGAIFE